MMDIVNQIKELDNVKVTVQRENRIFVDVDKDRVIGTLYSLKLMGFHQLSVQNAVDWIKEGEFEVFYVLYSHQYKVNVIVRTRVDRDNPIMETAEKIYPSAHTWEREITEMFGIKFKGNDESGKPFILENWKEIPPLRKDFDSVKYCNEHFVFRHSEEGNE